MIKICTVWDLVNSNPQNAPSLLLSECVFNSTPEKIPCLFNMLSALQLEAEKETETLGGSESHTGSSVTSS